MGTAPFLDRSHAGRLLAERLRRHRGRPSLVVVALAPDGVPVGFEVARALRAPLDVLAVRALPAPSEPTVTIGAVTGTGVAVVESDLCEDGSVSDDLLDEMIGRATAEAGRLDRIYHERCPRLDVHGRPVVVVDDGLASTSVMRAAIRSLERSSPTSIVVAVPIAAVAACAELSTRFDELVYCEPCAPGFCVGSLYGDDAAVSDADVCRMLAQAKGSRGRPGAAAA